jgi:hypothetical protein
MKHAPSKALCFLPASYWFLDSLNFQPFRWRRHVPPKRRTTLHGLYNVISHTTRLFRIICASLFIEAFWRFTVHFKPKAALEFSKLLQKLDNVLNALKAPARALLQLAAMSQWTQFYRCYQAEGDKISMFPLVVFFTPHTFKRIPKQRRQRSDSIATRFCAPDLQGSIPDRSIDISVRR